MGRKIRLLRADEIECRVGATYDNLVSLLLYKDARVDMRILDETFGPDNWKRTHEVVNDNLFCTVSIWDAEKKEWVGKQDVGVESNTEAVKGEASDSFKRACFNWGIGRELYSAPNIWIEIGACDKNSKGKIKTRFSVQSIDYNDKDEINSLIIVDDKGVERYRYPKTSAKAKPLSIAEACAEMRRCKTKEEIQEVWNKYPEYHAENSEFWKACVERGTQLQR